MRLFILSTFFSQILATQMQANTWWSVEANYVSLDWVLGWRFTKELRNVSIWLRIVVITDHFHTVVSLYRFFLAFSLTLVLSSSILVCRACGLFSSHGNAQWDFVTYIYYLLSFIKFLQCKCNQALDWLWKKRVCFLIESWDEAL